MSGGSVSGQISVPNVVINGAVIGDIFATKSIKLEPNALVEGNIYYNDIEIEKGATVSGSLVREVPQSNISSISKSDKMVGDGLSKPLNKKS